MTFRHPSLIACCVIALASVPLAAADSEELACPTIEAEATDEGILLTWTSHDERTDEYMIHRSPNDGFGEGEAPWVTVDASTTSYLDTNVTAGVTYVYQVNPGADRLDTPGDGCSVEVTAVPFFGAPLLGALALVGACGVYAWMGRR